MILSARYEKHAIYQSEYLDQIADLIGNGNNIGKAYKITFTVLMALRNRLKFQQALNFLYNLPLPFQAIFAHNWKIDDKVPLEIKNIDELLFEIIKVDKDFYRLGITNKTEAFHALKAVFKVIGQHVSTKEMENIYNLLPKDISTNLKISGKQYFENNPDSSIWYS